MNPRDTWLKETRTLADALRPQPPTEYVVDRLFGLPSLNIVYGAPGTMKSLLLADLAVSVSIGRAWLPPMPHDQVKPIATKACSVLWLDFDNGERRTANRFAAFARAYHAPEDAPLRYLAMPSAPFDATKTGSVVEMVDLIKTLDAHFVVIDNLLTVSGGKDENAPEIGVAMINLRLLSERTDAAVVVIHHARKQSGFRGGLGDDLRGHSSIRGAIDLGLLVEREEGSDIVTVKSTKTRDVDVEPFAALWTYNHITGTHDLETAAFFGQKVMGTETSGDIEDAILRVLAAAGKALNQSDLVKAVKAEGVQAGRDRIRSIAEHMVQSLKLKKSTGARGAALYAV